jgi:hypothetical protein
VTNNPFNVLAHSGVQTAGATAAFEPHGNLTIDVSALASAAEAVFADNNTGTVVGAGGAIDTTGQLFLQTSVAFTVASASNVATGRELVAESVQ